MKVGIVDIDTSHAQDWIPILRDLGHHISGLWDGGDIHPSGYADEFAHHHTVPVVYPSLQAMAAEVDCGIILGCNWDSHIEKARPFVEAGKAILIDKPLAGNLTDLNQIRAWARDGIRITGGSSLRFCMETQNWLATPVEERGIAHTALCGCGFDDFQYGIHAYSLLCGIMGGGAHSVRCLDSSPFEPNRQQRYQVNWRDGRMAFVVVGTSDWMGFYATIITSKGATQFHADTSKLYRTFLERVLPYLSAEGEQPPLLVDELLEPELCALAALQSRQGGGETVQLSDIHGSIAYSGQAFADKFRAEQYPLAAQ